MLNDVVGAENIGRFFHGFLRMGFTVYHWNTGESKSFPKWMPNGGLTAYTSQRHFVRQY